MPFTYKLSQRLARMKRVLLLVTPAVTACERPVASVSGPAPVVQVVVSPASVTLLPSQSQQFTAFGRTATDDSVAVAPAWSASGGAISSSGLYTAGSTPGRYQVTATLAGGSVVGSALVTVTTVPVASVAVSPATLSLTAGQTGRLTATPKDSAGNALSGRTVSWISGDAGVARVSAAGVVTAVAAGSTTVTATSEGKSGSATITVTTVPVASVSVTPPSATLAAGQTVQLSATPRDSNGNALAGRPVAWASGDAGVARVSAAGVVTALAAGSATVTATSEGKSGSATITVTTVPVASVSVTPPSATLAPGQTVQLSATPRDANGNALAGRPVAWTSGDTTVATVNGSGLVTAVAAGGAARPGAPAGRGGRGG